MDTPDSSVSLRQLHRRHADAQKLTPRRRARTSVRCAGSALSGARARYRHGGGSAQPLKHCTWSIPAPRRCRSNAAISGLKFFFDITLQRGELMARMQPVRMPQRLPVVLSREEVARLIAACTNLASDGAVARPRDRAASERSGLAQGQRHRQRAHDPAGRAGQRPQGSLRDAPTAPAAGAVARGWRVARAQGKMPMAAGCSWAQPDRVRARVSSIALFRHAALAAGIEKRVSMHTLRHCFATTCSNRRSTSASSRRCSATRNSTPR